MADDIKPWHSWPWKENMPSVGYQKAEVKGRRLTCTVCGEARYWLSKSQAVPFKHKKGCRYYRGNLR